MCWKLFPKNATLYYSLISFMVKQNQTFRQPKRKSHKTHLYFYALFRFSSDFSYSSKLTFCWEVGIFHLKARLQWFWQIYADSRINSAMKSGQLLKVK